MQRPHDATILVARILIVAIFVYSGSLKVMGPAVVMKIMGAHGIPLLPAAIAVTILVEFGCSLLIVLGFKARWAAVAIILWFIPATIIFHVVTHQTLEWLKNLGLIGGLLLIVDMGPGAYSLDGILGRARSQAPVQSAA